MEGFSSRLFEILSKFVVSESLLNSDDNEKLNGESDNEDESFPLECCYCGEYFFNRERGKDHECSKLKGTKDIIIKRDPCCDDCGKSFKKSSDLRKHQVRTS